MESPFDGFLNSPLLFVSSIVAWTLLLVSEENQITLSIDEVLARISTRL